MTESFTDWLRANAVALTHLDVDAPLDDLEPLREIIGDARVVALGENSHFIDEFAAMRERVLRFLAERCGFTVLAFEYGFSEGFPLDAWARGEGTDDGLADHVGDAIPIGLDGPLHWIRRHNRTAARPVRFAGIDIPAAGGSLLPALTPVAGYLREVDPAALPMAESAIAIAATFAGGSGAVAAPAWERLPAAEQDALSANLMRLLVRFGAVEALYVERSDQRTYDIARRRVEAACAADYTFRAMAGLFAGKGLTADTSARDVYMAESVLWHLERSEPGTRVVLPAHNAHIQTEPISFGGVLTGFPMGQHLRRILGEDYFALGLTSTGGSTGEMRLDANARFGFVVEDTPLAPPEPGSIEAAWGEPGFAVADLRRARRETSAGHPDRLRMHSGYLETPVLTSFDGMLNTGTSTVAEGANG
ncbi:erythromycin esterase family protein [Phytomonospora endophytica]|uniref:Erythromycin esterase n=1 Tax=Phytomonospora endophytica TaxID=714109 RepID=A0A841G191_9ACTN|nr:erythromycin esterase family protein [Phytomonospora endophytica]MBB6037930.1 erythromycin esterase [Phytomonospora endophytica]GIG68830.1 erythromycin esterase [Phytomonospora endophytica]